MIKNENKNTLTPNIDFLLNRLHKQIEYRGQWFTHEVRQEALWQADILHAAKLDLERINERITQLEMEEKQNET